MEGDSAGSLNIQGIIGNLTEKTQNNFWIGKMTGLELLTFPGFS